MEQKPYIFIVFEGLPSQIVLRVDKTLHESVSTIFGQGVLIAAAILKVVGASYRGEEEPEMHPQGLDLDYDIDGKGCLDQDVDGKGCLDLEQLEESIFEQG